MNSQESTFIRERYEVSRAVFPSNDMRGRVGIDTTKASNLDAFTSGQKQLLEFHRNSVLLQSIAGARLDDQSSCSRITAECPLIVRCRVTPKGR